MPLPRALSLSLFTPPRPASTLHTRRPVDLRTIDATFGLPSTADPDPFGVLALERAGLAIKEAGSRHRASSEAFEYRPSPTSPVFRLSLQSHDGHAGRAAGKGNRWSMKSMDQGTQTADLPEPVEEEQDGITLDPPVDSQDSFIAAPAPAYHSPIREHEVEAPRRPLFGGDFVQSPDVAHADEAKPSPTSPNLVTTIENDVPIAVVAEAVQGPIVAKAKLVNIKGRPAPAVPSRNPLRAVRMQAAEAVVGGDLSADDSSSAYSISPTRSGFDEDSPKPWSEQTSVFDAESIRLKGDGSRQASLDVQPDGDHSRQEPQDVESPLSREVGNEMPPRRNLSGSTLDQHEESATELRKLTPPAVSIVQAVDSTEVWKDEDEFHSVPASPTVSPV